MSFTAATSAIIESGEPFLRRYILEARNGYKSAGKITFVGAGKQDMATCGKYTGTTSKSYRVQIDGLGIPDTFKWSDDNGFTWNIVAVPITGFEQELNNGVLIRFDTTTGHTVGNYYNFTVTGYTLIPILQDGWERTWEEGFPTIATLDAKFMASDFRYHNEFDPANPLQMFAELRLRCDVYLNTWTGLTGTVAILAGSNQLVGTGSAFLTELSEGSIIRIESMPVVEMMVASVEGDEAATIYDLASVDLDDTAEIRDKESSYLFRGDVDECQSVDFLTAVSCFDPLHRLLTSRIGQPGGAWIMEAEKSAEYTDVFLMWDATANDPAGEYYTFSIEQPTYPWALDAFGNRRAFVPLATEVERWPVGGTAWELVPASEFVIVEAQGRVVFYLTQPLGTSLRIKRVMVYIEGTNELEDVIQAMLLRMKCNPAFGPGFDVNDHLLILELGNALFTNGSTTVTGAPGMFADLTAGDRITPNGSDFGIVDTINVGAGTLELYYVYPGATTLSVPHWKSTLRASYLTISRVYWEQCQGYAIDMIRELQKLYADSRGYRIWYDPDLDKIMGDRIELSANFIQLGPIQPGLTTLRSTENICSAIAVAGPVGRPENLSAPQSGGSWTVLSPAEWTFGITDDPTEHYGDMYWGCTAAAITALYDVALQTVFAIKRNWKDQTPPWDSADWVEWVKRDFGSKRGISQIVLYGMLSKNPNNFPMGVRILGSDDDVTYVELSPETYEIEVKSNDVIKIDLEGVAVRYIKFLGRPYKWMEGSSSAAYRHIGLREIIIFGSSKLCETVFVTANPADAMWVGNATSGQSISIGFPDLLSKMANVGYQLRIDEPGVSMTIPEARERAAIVLNELIRLYQQVTIPVPFDPRLKIYNTAHVSDIYRTGAPADFELLVTSIKDSESGAEIGGIDYSSGVLT